MPEVSSPTDPILRVEGLVKTFPVRQGLLGGGGTVRAVDGVNLDVAAGETLGIVGESGCGKTTLGKTVMRLLRPDSGRIILNGDDITELTDAALRHRRRDIQMVFQDPFSSLNPRLKNGKIVAEPLEIHGIGTAKERNETVLRTMEKVGLRAEQADRYPHQLSGGQRQRLGLARALVLEPSVIIADEPVSALDVSIQAQVLNLMMDLQREMGLAYVFISHDLAVVEHIAHRIAVMYLGRVVEIADKRSLFANPIHPYSEALLAAVPVPDPKARRERAILTGDVPSPVDPPKGCAFHSRCPLATDACALTPPRLVDTGDGHAAACHVRAPG